jgi:hypothetical protein
MRYKNYDHGHNLFIIIGMDNNNTDNTIYMPLEMINHIGSFLDLKDFLNLCTAHRGMNALFHHPIGRKVYVDRYTKEIKYDDRTEWKYNGDLHREYDQPAIVHSDGTQEWYYHNKLHREHDQPAIVVANGYEAWYYHGELHRENDQPAIVWADGSKHSWYSHGKLHREHDQPAVVYTNGSKQWWYHGKCHRENQPAVVKADGSQEWWYHGYRRVGI